MNYTSTYEKLENAQVKITGELTWDDLNSYRAKSLKELQEKVSVDGFRKGHVPEDILIKKIGDMALLEEMARDALVDLYPLLLEKHNVQAIGRPDIQITKIASGSDLGFSIITATMPEVALPDVEKIAKKINKEDLDTTVDDKEVDDAILQLRKMKHQSDYMKEHEGEGDIKPPKFDEIKDEDLPELTEDYIKTLGEFATLEEFKTKLRDNIGEEKLAREKDKRRGELMDAILQESTIDAPEMLVEYELDKMMAQMEHDIAMAGMTTEQYLESTNKTRDDVRNEMRETAQKRAHMQLIINKIASDKEIVADTEKVEHELEHAREMYKDHKEFDPERARAYFESVHLNQAVLEYLEGIK